LKIENIIKRVLLRFSSVFFLSSTLFSNIDGEKLTKRSTEKVCITPALAKKWIFTVKVLFSILTYNSVHIQLKECNFTQAYVCVLLLKLEIETDQGSHIKYLTVKVYKHHFSISLARQRKTYIHTQTPTKKTSKFHLGLCG
jgi:hypothetical protein